MNYVNSSYISYGLPVGLRPPANVAHTQYAFASERRHGVTGLALLHPDPAPAREKKVTS